MSKVIPQPRKSPWGTPYVAGETWMECSSNGARRARVRFPDGKLRVVRVAGAADTYFSTPCYSHDGYITTQETKWNSEGEAVFRPHDKSKHIYGSW